MIHIYCDGGLGNRLLMMFSGLYFASQANKPFIIHWPANNWCGCNFNDIFDNEYNTTNFNLKLVDDILHNCTLLIHADQIGHKPNKMINNINLSKQTMIDLFKSEPNILYFGDSLHKSLTPTDIIEVINQLKISKNILDKVSKFNIIDHYGIHVRGTDFPEAPLATVDQLENEVKNNTDKKYFICSDQKDIENIFKKYENIIMLEKTNYVERLDKTKGWNGRITDDLNRSFNFNVDRNKVSVIEAFCDMILLSKTKLIKTSNSSFLKCAYILSKGKLL